MGPVSHFPISPSVTTYRVRLDNRRRPTLPAALLKEAEIDGEGTELIARVEGTGRVVLEDPMALLRDLQDEVVEEMKRNHDDVDLAMELIMERQLDAGLR